MAVLWVDASHVCSGSMPLATGRATSAVVSALPLLLWLPCARSGAGKGKAAACLECPARLCHGVSFPLQVNGWAEVCARGLQCQHAPQHPQPLQGGTPWVWVSEVAAGAVPKGLHTPARRWGLGRTDHCIHGIPEILLFNPGKLGHISTLFCGRR